MSETGDGGQAAPAETHYLGSPWASCLLGLVGIALGVAVLFVGAADSQAKVFQTPAFAVWIILYIGQIALWLVLAPSAWGAAVAAARTFGPIRWTGLAVCVVFLIPALFLPSLVSAVLPGLPITSGRGDEHLLAFLGVFRWRLIITLVIALLVLISPSVAEIWIIQSATTRPGTALSPQADAAAGTEWATMIRLYLEARGHLQAALLRLGLAISALTLVTAQLRNAEVAYIDPGASGSAAEGIFPNAYVLLYGLYFTCLLAVIYLPAAQALVSAGREIRRQVAELKAVDGSTFGAWFQLHKNLGDLLQLDADNLGQLKTAVSILAPVVGSLVGVSAGK